MQKHENLMIEKYGKSGGHQNWLKNSSISISSVFQKPQIERERMEGRKQFPDTYYRPDKSVVMNKAPAHKIPMATSTRLESEPRNYLPSNFTKTIEPLDPNKHFTKGHLKSPVKFDR
jgi:hypothetical protein